MRDLIPQDQGPDQTHDAHLGTVPDILGADVLETNLLARNEREAQVEVADRLHLVLGLGDQALADWLARQGLEQVILYQRARSRVCELAIERSRDISV